jgi:tetratricopeptide (TPR) repeat protein
MPCMRHRLHQPLLALLLSWLLACPPPPAQGGQSSSSDADSRALVKPDPKRAKKLAELGAKQEAAGAYEQALAAYEEAARYAPFDVTIVSKGAVLRSKLVRSHVDNAERFALESNFQGATQELAAALHIDPSNAVLLERLQQLEAMRATAKDRPAEEPPEGLPKVAPDKVKRDFHLQTDLKAAYEQVAAAYGIKASFDPDLMARTVRLRLEEVDFDTAMKVLSAETGTFWKAVDAKQIFVAADTAEKRKAFEPEIEQTFELPVSTTAAEMTEIVRAVRDLTGAQKIQQSNSSHSLTIRDTVPRVHLAGAIIEELERSHGEVLLEIDLLEVDRNNAIQMGITPPSSLTLYYLDPPLLSQLRAAASLSALLTIVDSVFGTSAATTIPSVAVFGGGKSTFLLNLPSLSAQFSQALSLVHSGRQVLMRAQDGKPATFFVGERYPITLSLLSNSLGTSAQTPSVGGTSGTLQSEQFTVGQGPVSMATADFRNIGVQDLAVLNQTDDTITILLNQGAGASTQFVQATGSPISLNTGSTKSTVVSPAAALTVTTATLQSIAVTPAAASLAPGGTQQFAAIGTFSDGSQQDISSNCTWASSSSAVASIASQTGLALGQGPGTTLITATLGSIVSPSATLTGTSASLKSIAITPATASIAKSGTQQFTATGTFSDGSKQNVTTSATWSTSNFNVATIGTASGLARGIAAGSAQIQATLDGIASPTAALTVTSATLQSIAVTPASATIAVGTSQHFVATGTYSDGTTEDITSTSAWASSSSATATIAGASGVATGIAAGTTSITATQGGTGTPVSIAAGNLNSINSAYADLAVASQTTNTVSILLGNGDGTFSNFQSYQTGNRPSAIALGAFNANTNTYPGFVVTNFVDNSFSVFTGNGNGTFTEVRGSPFPLPSGQSGPIGVAVGDFNQDGLPDLAILNQTTNNVTILEGKGDGTFQLVSNTPLSTGSFPVAIASGALGGSTGPALAIANQNDNTVTVYLGNGNGTFTAAAQSPLAAGSSPAGVAIGDFANTGYGGIAVTNQASGSVTGYLDEGTGSFSSALATSVGTNPGAILVGDFTSSTYPDIAIADNIPSADGLVVLLVSPASFVTGASSGQVPYPGSEYADIGLKIKATPYVHDNKEVTLQMEFEIKALAGSNVNGIPIITNRSVTQTIRLKEDETSIVTGFLDREETKALTGLPGLAQIPGAGYLFGSHNNSFTDDQLLILITPRRMRSPDHDSRKIYAGRGDPAGRGAAGTSAPAAPPTTVEPEPRPENPPAPAPGTVPPAQAPPAQPPPQEPPNQENQPPPAAPPPARPEP